MSYDPQQRIKAKSLRSDTIKNLVRNVVFPGKIFKDATNEHKSVQRDTQQYPPSAPKDVKSGAAITQVAQITRKFSQVNSVLFQKKKTNPSVVIEEVPLRKIAHTAHEIVTSKPHSFDIEDIPMPGDSKMAVSFEEHNSIGHVKSVSTPHTVNHQSHAVISHTNHTNHARNQANKGSFTAHLVEKLLDKQTSRIQSTTHQHQHVDFVGTYRENTNTDLYGRIDTSLVDELDDEDDNDELEKTNNSLIPSSNSNLQISQQQQRKHQLQKNSYNCKSFDMRTKNAKELLSRLCPKNPVKGIGNSIPVSKQLLVGKRQSLSRVHSNANNGLQEFHKITDLKTNTNVSNIPAHKCSRSAVSWAFADSKMTRNEGKRDQNLKEDSSPRFQAGAYVTASPNHGPSVSKSGLRTARDLDSSAVESNKIIVSDFVSNTMTSVPKKNLTKNIKDLKNAATFSKLSSKIYDHEKFIDEALMKDETLIQLQADSLADYDLGELIGRGSYATVRLGQHRPSRMRVAVKQYDKFKLFDPLKRTNVLNEIMNLAKLKHKNVVRLVNWIFSAHQVCIVMDFGGTNFELFLRNNQGKVPKNLAKNVAFQIADALKYCHDNGVVHRDMKADNILIDEATNKITLIDFGFSSFVESSTRCTVFCGTPNYMAPEVVRKTPYDGMAADMWAFGVVLYRILTGNFPFQHPSEKELYGLILKSQYQMPSDLPPSAVDLLKKLLNAKPSERLTSTQVCEHPWFHSVDP